MTAHKYIEDNSTFEDIENLTTEVVDINVAHEAAKIATREAYQDVLNFIASKRESNAIEVGYDWALNTIEDYIKLKIK